MRLVLVMVLALLLALTTATAVFAETYVVTYYPPSPISPVSAEITYQRSTEIGQRDQIIDAVLTVENVITINLYRRP